MKKYLQIIIVLASFGLLVVVRQLKGSESLPVVGSSSNPVNPMPTNTPVQDTPTPTAAASAGQLTQIPTAIQSPTATPTPKPQGQYKDGSYAGSVQDAFYGNIQVKAVISGGKITDVVFLQFPNDNRTSQYINSQADPMLKQEAIQAQSAQINGVSGASASSQAFQASLADALSQAK
jgi:uncharacterized protein with FMN-binding domain